MEKEPKIYEIGYLLSPFIPEEKIDNEIADLRKLIEERQGLIVNEQRAKLQKLAYTIKKPHKGKFDSVYFGWIKFMTRSSVIPEIKSAFDKKENIVRFLVTKILKEEPLKRAVKKIVKKKIVTPLSEKPKTEVQLEEIDKKLEELIGA